MVKSAKARQMDAQSRADIKYDRQDRLDKAKADKSACLKEFNIISKQVAFGGDWHTYHAYFTQRRGG